MKPCIGCKHLVAHGAACKGDEQLTRTVDPLTGSVRWEDLRFPPRGFRPSPQEMRAGRCGPERKLYAPKLWERLSNAVRAWAERIKGAA